MAALEKTFNRAGLVAWIRDQAGSATQRLSISRPAGPLVKAELDRVAAMIELDGADCSVAQIRSFCENAAERCDFRADGSVTSRACTGYRVAARSLRELSVSIDRFRYTNLRREG